MVAQIEIQTLYENMSHIIKEGNGIIDFDIEVRSLQYNVDPQGEFRVLLNEIPSDRYPMGRVAGVIIDPNNSESYADLSYLTERLLPIDPDEQVTYHPVNCLSVELGDFKANFRRIAPAI